MRETIDFGIDLGITNSSIAVHKGAGTEVFKNNEGQEATPSAVWIDGRGRLYVGRLAQERLEDDSANAFSEFKLQMGKDMMYNFPRSGRRMKPEELSAEVLKSLRGDVLQRTGEQIYAAVITVPAAFELPQTNATIEAARFAGFEYVQLLMEPSAAAYAYGFDSESNSVYWMVYDFGGGTFDVSVIQLRDGDIKIVSHSGDNHLGGKLIDWEIVDKIFVPALERQYRLFGFNRSNPKWKAAFAKLKLHAENARIQLSRNDDIGVLVDSLCLDDRGKPVKFEYDLKRPEVETLTEPLIERSIGRTRKLLQESRLSPADIGKVILVGEFTLTPLVRDMLAKRLNMPLDFSKDPLTIYAQGAAIFAGGKTIPLRVLYNHQPQTGAYKLELHYQPFTNEPEPLIGGKVIDEKDKSLVGFTIEIIDKKNAWRSGKISLSSTGTFTTTLHMADSYSEFLIELRDTQGNICPAMPDHFYISCRGGHSPGLLINSVGIVLANGRMRILIPKGTLLPANKRVILHTTKEMKRGQTGELLKIPVVEGEITKRADRNRVIGSLVVDGREIRRDVPLGSEIEIKIMIDESRIVTTRAFIPVLDEDFENVLKFDPNSADPEKMKVEFNREKKRFENARIAAQQAGVNRSSKALNKIQGEDMIHEIESLLAAARTDLDAAEKCNKRLLDFEIAIDEVEDNCKWPPMVAEAETWLNETRQQVEQEGTDIDRVAFIALEKETRTFIAAMETTELLEQKKDQLRNLYCDIILRKIETWISLFQHVEQQRSTLNDQNLARRLFDEGYRAIYNNDIQALQSVVRQLYGLKSDYPINFLDDIIWDRF